MNPINVAYFMRKAEIGLIVIILLFGISSLLSPPWNETVENSLIDLQFKLRGERRLADEFVFVFIGAEDAQALGGWPLTRDYYGYMTHVLSRLGAKVIGFDILFDTPNRNYPEFDNILIDFFQSAGNVCLPMTFAELADTPQNFDDRSYLPKKIFAGQNPTFPFAQLKNSAAGLGFSNFDAEPIIRQAPLIVADDKRFKFAFGVELARLFLRSSRAISVTPNAIIIADETSKKSRIPIDAHGQLRLNHFGGIECVSAWGFVELLKTFERAPDSLNFKDKIVLVAATLPGAPTLKATPLSDALPATLIHATVAENLIHQNFLRELPKLVSLFFIVLMAAAARLLWRVNPIKLKIGGGFGVLSIYFIVAQLFFCKAHLILPLFYPTLVFLFSLIFLSARHERERRALDDSLKQLLQEQIAAKEAELEMAETKLAEAQNIFQQQTASSEQIRRLADERRQAILHLEKELRDLRTHVVSEERSASPQFPEIVHAPNGKMAPVLALVEKVGVENIPVLISGETGAGKEMIARAIHQAGKRKNAPFVAVNCGALPETLLESELFGHEKGSFTGAVARRHGRFELADNGTIFLDEISETTPAFQARLLRVLQDGAFERLGGEQTITVDVRLIAACNKDLPTEVKAGRFRADLFYRLNGFPIALPPLRERHEDVPLLALHFLKKYAATSVTAFSDRAMEIFARYHWPGNVRELENVVRRAAILAQSERRRIIQADDLPPELAPKESSQAAAIVYQSLETQILEMLRALKFSRSAISQTAKALGNRDRGTITEYFRGMCFEQLVNVDFNVEKAARAIAAASDEETVGRVRVKIDEYLKNLRAPDASEALFRGLPKKYHPCLQQVIQYFSKNL
jgi:two-component system NtrC family response regulator